VGKSEALPAMVGTIKPCPPYNAFSRDGKSWERLSAAMGPGGRMTMLGTLYGIGVGPGDPDLLTLKAVKILKEVSHVFAASSSKNDYSLARSIVNGHLPVGSPGTSSPFR